PAPDDEPRLGSAARRDVEAAVARGEEAVGLEGQSRHPCTVFGALGTGPLMVTSSALSRAVAVNAQLLLSSVSVVVLPFALSAKASNVTLYVPSLTRFTLPSESGTTVAELVASLLETRTLSSGS